MDKQVDIILGRPNTFDLKEHNLLFSLECKYSSFPINVSAITHGKYKNKFLVNFHDKFPNENFFELEYEGNILHIQPKNYRPENEDEYIMKVLFEENAKIQKKIIERKMKKIKSKQVLPKIEDTLQKKKVRPREVSLGRMKSYELNASYTSMNFAPAEKSKMTIFDSPKNMKKDPLMSKTFMTGTYSNMKPGVKKSQGVVSILKSRRKRRKKRSSHYYHKEQDIDVTKPINLCVRLITKAPVITLCITSTGNPTI